MLHVKVGEARKGVRRSDEVTTSLATVSFRVEMNWVIIVSWDLYLSLSSQISYIN